MTVSSGRGYLERQADAGAPEHLGALEQASRRGRELLDVRLREDLGPDGHCGAVVEHCAGLLEPLGQVLERLADRRVLLRTASEVFLKIFGQGPHALCDIAPVARRTRKAVHTVSAHGTGPGFETLQTHTRRHSFFSTTTFSYFACTAFARLALGFKLGLGLGLGDLYRAGQP